MKKFIKIPGFGVLDLNSITAVGNYSLDDNYKVEYKVYTYGGTIKIYRSVFDRVSLLNLIQIEPDEEWKDE